MVTYDDLKKRAKEALDTIADVSVEAYKVAEEKTKILARRAVLNAEITRERAAIRRAKIRIGDTYYELHKDDPEEPIEALCNTITDSLDLIAGKQKELEELKKGYAAKDESERRASEQGADDCCAGDCCEKPEQDAGEAPKEE